MVKDYTRKITHQDYKNPEKLKKYYHRVVKQIYTCPKNFEKERSSGYNILNNSFISAKPSNIIVPIIGGVSLCFVLIILNGLRKGEDIDIFFIGVLILCSFSTIFFLIYGLTMPQKEHILNRKDRQQDYERRKAEGFPKPLYPSNIPTPEATKEQQAERKRIGGW